MSIPTSDDVTGPGSDAAVDALQAEAAGQVWFAAAEVFSALADRAYSEIPLRDTERRELDEGLAAVAAAALACGSEEPMSAGRDAQLYADHFTRVLSELNWTLYLLNGRCRVDVDSDGWNLSAVSASAEHLHRELWQTGTPGLGPDVGRLWEKLSNFHLFLSECRMSGTPLGLVIGLLAAGVPLDEARAAVGAAVGAQLATATGPAGR